MRAWKCLNAECGHYFTAEDIKPWHQKDAIGWRWCPKCRASSRRVCSR